MASLLSRNCHNFLKRSAPIYPISMNFLIQITSLNPKMYFSSHAKNQFHVWSHHLQISSRTLWSKSFSSRTNRKYPNSPQATLRSRAGPTHLIVVPHHLHYFTHSSWHWAANQKKLKREMEHNPERSARPLWVENDPTECSEWEERKLYYWRSPSPPWTPRHHQCACPFTWSAN